MFKVLVNYNFTPDPTWIGEDYLIFDRSDDGLDHLKDFDPSKIVKTENVGQVDFDKLNYLVDYYDNLPDVFLWGKTNLFKYITPEEYDGLKDNQTFTPLLTQGHKTYSDNNGLVNYYSGNMYFERNDNWYMAQFPSKYFNSYAQFAREFQIKNPPYIPFAPGGNYILNRDTVYKYGRDFYAKMSSFLPYCREPAEAQLCERAYYNMWYY